jgi:hypothetical protein
VDLCENADSLTLMLCLIQNMFRTSADLLACLLALWRLAESTFKTTYSDKRSILGIPSDQLHVDVAEMCVRL